MSNVFWTGCNHFDHDDILKYTKATRPYPDVEAMNEDMARIWNATVDNKDLVYIVGDFAFKNHRKWINALNGKKVMLIGSHDDMPHDTMDLFLGDEAWKAAGYEQSKASAEKTWHQFREVHDSLIRRVCGQMIHMYHWPLQSWQDKPKGAWHLHSHVHGRLVGSLPSDARKGLILDVGWDVWKRPVEFAEIKMVMNEKWSGRGVFSGGGLIVNKFKVICEGVKGRPGIDRIERTVSKIDRIEKRQGGDIFICLLGFDIICKKVSIQ